MNLLFGPGDTDFARWVLLVRIDILIFLITSLIVLADRLSRLSRNELSGSRSDFILALALTAIAAALRFIVVESNLSELGGIGYSRILLGYRGHFGAAQLYSLVYARGARNLETAIFLNRLASTLTVPLTYALCRRLAPQQRAFAPIATALIVLHPLHVLFAATDALGTCSSFLAVASYLLLTLAVGADDRSVWLRSLSAVAAAAGLALLTQVRYENLLLVVPAVVFLLRARRARGDDHGRKLSLLRVLGPALLLFAVLFVAYTVEAMLAGSSFQNPVQLRDLSAEAVREAFDNAIFAIGPLLAGTAAAILARRSRIRLLAALPFLAVLPLMILAGPPAPHFARTFANELLLPALVAGYGLALVWEARWRVLRLVPVGCVLWMAALTVLFWPRLREQHLEIAEHDFLRASFASLPPGIDRIIVPDDETLDRVTHSTIELTNKYRMIAAAAGATSIDLVGMTRFIERPGEIDCGRGNCLILLGAPCTGVRHYWFAADGCAKLAASAGPPVSEVEIVTGSFLDCSVYRGAERQRLCEPERKARRLGLYRIANTGSG